MALTPCAIQVRLNKRAIIKEFDYMKKTVIRLFIILFIFLLSACTNYEQVYNTGNEHLRIGNYTELNETLIILSEGEPYLYDQLVYKVDQYVIEKFNEFILFNQITDSRSFLITIQNELDHFESSRYDILEARLLFAENQFYQSLKILDKVKVSDEDLNSHIQLQRENISYLVAEIYQYYWDARTISDYILIEEQLKYVFSLLSDREKYLLTYSLMDLQWHHLNFGLNEIFLERFVKSHLPQYYQDFLDKNSSFESLTLAPSSTQLANNLEPKAVIVNVFNSSGRKSGNGSGFFINDNGLIATNEHVIRDASRISIQMNDGTTHDVRVLLKDEKRDFAILKAPVSNNDFVTLGNSYQVQTGETIFTYGSPLGISNTMTTGLISKNLSIVIRQEFIQVTAPISPGSSGGMLVNEFGQVIGITTGNLITGQNMNFAIPINRVINLINEVDPNIQLNPKGNGHHQSISTKTIRKIHRFSYEELEESTIFGFLDRDGEYVFAIINYANGDRFQGELSEGSFSGKGIFETGGYHYYGQFENGEITGFGVTEFSDGSYYVGQKLRDKFHGQGSFYWGRINNEQFGHAYIGNFVNGVKSGKGIYLFPNGDIYEGNFVDDVRTGFGTYIWSNGNMYEGDFVDGEANGKGIFRFANGDILEGNFINGVIDGKGTKYFTNGNIYEGDFTDGVRTGKGTLRFTNGDIYEGDFINGSRTGKGTLRFANGDIYEGDFLNGDYSGQGEYFSVFGFIHRGNFLNGSPSGHGTRIFMSGDRFVAEWTSWLDGIGTYYFRDGSSRFTRLIRGVWN